MPAPPAPWPSVSGAHARRCDGSARWPGSAPAALLLSLAALLLAGPARAGSATSESIWDRRHALQEALQQVPPGANVTDQRCQELEVGLDNLRYRCTVEWQDPTGTPPP